MEVDGSLRGTPSILNRSSVFGCDLGVTRCTNTKSNPSSLAFTSTRALAAPQDLLGNWRGGSSPPTTTVLFPGTMVRYGNVNLGNVGLPNNTFSHHEIGGTLQFRATFASTHMPNYVDDALRATRH